MTASRSGSVASASSVEIGLARRRGCTTTGGAKGRPIGVSCGLRRGRALDVPLGAPSLDARQAHRLFVRRGLLRREPICLCLFGCGSICGRLLGRGLLCREPIGFGLFGRGLLALRPAHASASAAAAGGFRLRRSLLARSAASSPAAIRSASACSAAAFSAALLLLRACSASAFSWRDSLCLGGLDRGKLGSSRSASSVLCAAFSAALRSAFSLVPLRPSRPPAGCGLLGCNPLGVQPARGFGLVGLPASALLGGHACSACSLLRCGLALRLSLLRSVRLA